jgi:hypothetical protein
MASENRPEKKGKINVLLSPETDIRFRAYYFNIRINIGPGR